LTGDRPEAGNERQTSKSSASLCDEKNTNPSTRLCATKANSRVVFTKNCQPLRNYCWKIAQMLSQTERFSSPHSAMHRDGIMKTPCSPIETEIRSFNHSQSEFIDEILLGDKIAALSQTHIRVIRGKTVRWAALKCSLLRYDVDDVGQTVNGQNRVRKNGQMRMSFLGNRKRVSVLSFG
jgi:hypothetical protein